MVQGVADAVGADPLTSSRARRRTARARDGAHLRGRRPPRAAATAGLDARHGDALASSTSSRAGTRSSPRPASSAPHDVYDAAGITDPRREVDVAELYVPFSWYEPMWLEGHDIAAEGEGWKLIDDGATQLDGGDIPWNRSGGVLSSNPIGASGMLRFVEAALQVRGTGRRAPGRRGPSALGQAYGGGSQYFAMWVVGTDKP